MAVVLFVVGTLCVVLSVVTYRNSMMEFMLRRGGELVEEDASLLQDLYDPLSYARMVRQISQESGEDHESDAYFARFAPVVAQYKYRSLMDTLGTIASDEFISGAFVAYVSPDDPDKLVIVCDGGLDGVSPMQPGTWIDVLDSTFEATVDSESPHVNSWYLYSRRYGLVAICSTCLDAKDPDAASLYFVITTDQLVDAVTSFVRMFSVLLVALIVVGAWGLYHRLRRVVADPLTRIATAVEDYTKDREVGASKTEHFVDLDVDADNEIGRIASALAAMEVDIGDYIADVARISAEQERKNTELAMAGRIQQDALPTDFPAFPDRHEFELFALMDPARDVGGDFYDFFLVDDDHLCLLIADVSDKGVPAALFMMRAMATLKDQVMMGKGPAEALGGTNRSLLHNNKTGMFVTIWVGILDISTGVLRASNAGHEYPVLLQPGEGYELYEDRHGLMTGVMPGVPYTDYEIWLKPASKLFVYTDGVPEATTGGEERRMFGLDRLVEALNTAREATPEETLSVVRRAVGDFVGDAEQFDDITMLCLEYKGTSVRES